MEVDKDAEDEIDWDQIKHFVGAICNSSWMTTADETEIGRLLNNSAAIQDSFSREEKTEFQKEVISLYPHIDFKRALDFLIVELIKSSSLNEHITLYAIKMYMEIKPTNDFNQIIEDLLAELKLRESIAELAEKLKEANVVDVNWHKVNSLLNDLESCPSDEEYRNKIYNFLKTEPSLVLNAVQKCYEHTQYVLINRIVECLESQTDLKLWFIMLKDENLNLVLDICKEHKNFLQVMLKFFEKFAGEMETTYDEDLNSKYSHLNLDFDEFIQLFKLFLNEKTIAKELNEFLESKILKEDDNNFLFWVDVKACI